MTTNSPKIATPRNGKKKWCIGMSTYDDYDGVYFSVQAIRIYHAEIIDQIELLVVDNNPTGPCANALKSLENSIANFRYIPVSSAIGCIARNFIFTEANSEYVMVMDCHVLMLPGSLKRLIEYFDANPNSNDLVQGPLVHDDLTNISTHFEPTWNDGNFGAWGTDPRGSDPTQQPFDISMQGCGVFACRRAAWPGFNLRFRGFGAEEGYIHEKFRQRGARTLCAPFLRWTHRFNRPLGTPYPLNIADRIRNYLIGWHELGLEDAPIRDHFSTLLGNIRAGEIFTQVSWEQKSPLFVFDTIFYLDLSNSERIPNLSLHEFFEHIHISKRVVTIVSAMSEVCEPVRRLLSYRKIVQQAVKSGAQTILVIESIEEFTPALLAILGEDGKRLASGVPGGVVYHKSPRVNGAHCTKENISAFALNKSRLNQLLCHLPATTDSATKWLSEHGGLERLVGE